MKKDSYKNIEKFKQTKQRQKRRYYRKTMTGLPMPDWTKEEIIMVLKHEITDTEISAKIGRSVGAIQKKRCLLKKQNQ